MEKTERKPAPRRTPGDDPSRPFYVRSAHTPLVFKNVNALVIVAGVAQAVWTPAAGKKFRLMGFALSSSAAAAILLEYGAADTLMFRTPLLAAAGVIVSPHFDEGFMPGAAGEALKLDVSASATVSGFVFGTEE